MGWLWASSTPEPPKDQAKAPEQSSAPNEPVDPEIQKFFDLFKSETESASASISAKSAQANSSPDSQSESNGGLSGWIALKASAKASSSAKDEMPDAPIGDPLSEELLPTDMSCRQAFDLAWGCNALGGQFNAVYRYGNMRSCTEHWDDFWFCMRAKNYTGEVKENMIRQHYRNKAYAKYGNGKPSSEDVWESREAKLPPGSAFSEKFDPPTVGDYEWRRSEAERRSKIQKEMGYQS